MLTLKACLISYCQKVTNLVILFTAMVVMGAHSSFLDNSRSHSLLKHRMSYTLYGLSTAVRLLNVMIVTTSKSILLSKQEVPVLRGLGWTCS